MSEPSAKAKALIGHTVTYTGPRGKRSGKCTEVERVPGMTITVEDGKTYPAVRFRIGGKWTGAFADIPEEAQ